MTTSTVTIWTNGQLKTVDALALARLRPGAVRRKGVFETLSVSDGQPVMFPEHARRLHKGLKTLGLSCPYTSRDLSKALAETISANGLFAARARIAVWDSRSGSRVTVVAEPYCPPDAQALKRGWAALTVPVGRQNLRPAPWVKSLDYGLFARAWDQARRAGCDEALLVNLQGEVIEGSRTNLFVVTRGRVTTPSLSSGCLQGVMRKHVISFLRRKGCPVRQAAVTVSAILQADEAFVTNALIGVMPITSLNDHPISAGRPGPCAKTLRTALPFLR